jgi:hypothetical protein
MLTFGKFRRFSRKNNIDVILIYCILLYIFYRKARRTVFCLYAQVLQKQDKKSIATQENWQKCLNLSQGKMLNIEEDQWLFEARKQSKK